MLVQNGAMKALPVLRRWWSAAFVRTAVWGSLGLAGVAAGIVLAYELALARVPQHRATLERLVQAQTGLEVRFNELNLHWGWYGPEAVFHSVELGEPGSAEVLLRAPQLIVGFDAWRSVQRGQLQAGRITLIAPDIDFERGANARPLAGNSRARDTANQSRVRLLQRWRGGRIEIEGGTLRLPDAVRSGNALALQIRRVSLRHSGNQWSASALVFLPDRLGHTARLAAQLVGDLTQPKALSGSLRFDGVRLAFAGWRSLLSSQAFIGPYVPAAGDGDVSFRVSFDRGEIQKADGRVHAQAVSLAGGNWGGGVLNVERLRGDWRLAHQPAGWQLRVEDLDFGVKDSDSALPNFSLQIDAGGREAHGELGDTPLESLAAVTSWLIPQLELRGAELKGTARNVKFSWNDARPEGERLSASARADDFSLAPPTCNCTLSGLNARFSANESRLDIALDTEHGRLAMARAFEPPLEGLRIASELRLSRAASGWHLNTPLLTVDHGSTQLILSGSLGADVPADAALLDVRATLVRAEVPLLRELLGDAAVRSFGAVAASLTAGRIERAQFQLQTRLETQPLPHSAKEPGLFTGTLILRGGQLSGGEYWPEVQALDAQLDWNGERMRAEVDRGRAGPLELLSGQAQWSAVEPRPPQISGQARGRLELVLPWLSAYPRLEEYTPQLRHFAATGEGIFNFDVTAPNSVHAVVLLEGAQLQLAENLPSIQSVRGSLAFDKSRLQRSTLTGKWLGGPLTLRISERRERRAGVLAIQAQGFLDARELVALTGFAPLPEVTGHTSWSGEFAYRTQMPEHAAGWQLQAEANLVGIGSRLPEPLAKTVVTPFPLHVEASGSGNEAQVRVNLADRLRSQLALVRTLADSSWKVERGAVHFGSGLATIPAEPLIAVQGEVNRFDFSAYASLWQRAGNQAQVSTIVADLSAEQLWLADRMFPSVRVQARKAVNSRTEVHLTAQSLDAAERARIVTHLQDFWKDPIVTVN